VKRRTATSRLHIIPKQSTRILVVAGIDLEHFDVDQLQLVQAGQCAAVRVEHQLGTQRDTLELLLVRELANFPRILLAEKQQGRFKWWLLLVFHAEMLALP
jgi:hypothetical protein